MMLSHNSKDMSDQGDTYFETRQNVYINITNQHSYNMVSTDSEEFMSMTIQTHSKY